MRQPAGLTIAHYHMHPGGVTRIIDSQVKSLRENFPRLPIRILCGDAEDEQIYQRLDIPVIVNRNLNYLPEDALSQKDLREMKNRIMDFFNAYLGKGDILHFHNPNLGKNPLVTHCLYELTQAGYCIFNHAHDFAEDRPAMMNFMNLVLNDYLGQSPEELMYPLEWNNYHFGVINSFDSERLIKKGIPNERLHYVPNPVVVPSAPDKSVKKTFRKKIIESLHLNGERKIVTYPVRVIRRKNIGELILLSELFREEATFLVTLPPKNPVEIKPYERWKAFCKENEITNIHFEVGQCLEFKDLISGSDFCITTSIREGFGMAFMEPWLYNTPVTGRDIPYITKDFIDKGMDFKNLYNEIFLPDKEQDFKDLDEYEQMDYILTLKRNTTKIQRVMDFNKKLGNILIPVGSDIIEKNKNLIEKHYSLRNYGQKLMEAYKGFFI